MIPEADKYSPVVLRQETLRRPGYLDESIDDRQIKKLDEYFQVTGRSSRLFSYSESKIARDYGEHVQKQVEQAYKDKTIHHLVKLWSNMEPSTARHALVTMKRVILQ